MKIGIDLGTANILVYVKGKGIIITEPSVVAVSDDNRIVAVGEEAREMIGRTPGNIHAIRPMKDGVIADYVITEAMLSHFIGKVRKGRVGFGKPEVMISVPAGVTSVEKRAVRDAALKAGAKEAYLIEEPLAAAIGANVPISGPSGNMIIDIGGGTSEIAVIALGGIVVSHSLRVGGNRFDEAIATYIRKKYNLMVGERTAEEVKIQIGTALPLERELTMEVRGRDLIAGLPRTIPITSSEVMEAIEAPLQQLVAAVRSVLEQTPPELSSDIIDKGMVMSGGGALLRNVDKLLTQVTGVPVPCRREPPQLRRPWHRAGARALRFFQEVARPAGLNGWPNVAGCAPDDAARRRRAVRTRSRFIDLHCHSKGSFDCLSEPRDIVKAAHARGLTHLAITDHDRIDMALEARDIAPDGLTVIVGEEVKTLDGDLICVFLEKAIPPGDVGDRDDRGCSGAGCPGRDPASVRSHAGSLLRDASMATLAPLVDWVETHNARVVGHGNEDAQAFAVEHELAGVAVSDAHSIMEVGVAYTASTAIHRRRPVCSPPCRRPRSSRGERPTSFGSGRRSRRGSTGSAATAALPRAPNLLHATGPYERPERLGRHGRTAASGPWSGGRREGGSSRVWCDGVHTRDRLEAPAAPRTRVPPRSP